MEQPIASQDVNALLTGIARMDRPALVKLLRGLDCAFDIDFTDEYLASVDLDHLRHIVLTAGMHTHKDAQA